MENFDADRAFEEATRSTGPSDEAIVHQAEQFGEAIKQQANVTSIYFQALTERGFTRPEAMAFAAQWHWLSWRQMLWTNGPGPNYRA
jgi:hypothetical protein